MISLVAMKNNLNVAFMELLQIPNNFYKSITMFHLILNIKLSLQIMFHVVAFYFEKCIFCPVWSGP